MERMDWLDEGEHALRELFVLYSMPKRLFSLSIPNFLQRAKVVNEAHLFLERPNENSK